MNDRVPLTALPVDANALIIGYGSIGSRHAGILTEMGMNVSVVSARSGTHPQTYSSIAAAFEAKKFAYVIICNETSKHHASVAELNRLQYLGRLLIEKPLWQPSDPALAPITEEAFVAYHLRFDPLLLRLKELLQGKKLVTAEMRAGSYLPDWRPGRDYRETESAKRSAGGGVLRDMSHEIDFAQWIFGEWTELTASGGHLSPLEIETDDVFCLMAKAKACPLVTINLNYIDRQPEERWIVVNTTEETWRADLVGRTITKDGAEVYRTQAAELANHVAEFYRAENRSLIRGDTKNICTFNEGLKVVQIIGAAETASRDRKWIKL